MADERRYFDVDFGIDYTICARDRAHVIEVLRVADGDFAETWEAEGEPLITEIDPAELRRRRFIDEDGDAVALTTMQLGDYASTEF